jgi:hypothetical protein
MDDAQARSSSLGSLPELPQACSRIGSQFKDGAKRYRFHALPAGLPIEYDQLHFGFCYTEPVSSIPNVDNHSNYVKDVSAHGGDSY